MGRVSYLRFDAADHSLTPVANAVEKCVLRVVAPTGLGIASFEPVGAPCSRDFGSRVDPAAAAAPTPALSYLWQLSPPFLDARSFPIWRRRQLLPHTAVQNLLLKQWLWV